MLGVRTLPASLIVLCYPFNSNSDVARHVSLEDAFPVCAVAVRGDHFPPDTGFYSNSVQFQNFLSKNALSVGCRVRREIEILIFSIR